MKRRSRGKERRGCIEKIQASLSGHRLEGSRPQEKEEAVLRKSRKVVAPLLKEKDEGGG